MVDNVRVPSDGAGKRVTTNIYTDPQSNVDFHTQVVSVGDRTNPEHQQTILANGSSLTEFSTGAPVFNAFNRMLVTDDELLSAFKFYEGPKAVSDKIETETQGSATVSFDTNNLSYRCRVSPGSGNLAHICSHRHFSYKPGSSITMYFVIGSNTSSPINITYRGGMFTESDGIFLEVVDGEPVCVIRNSILGQEERVPQNQWNRDRLDGTNGDTNRSGATLDLTKMNIFAITYQYLSAGSVDLLTYVNGTPIVVHTFGHYGELTAPYMATTYLPHRFEIETTGTGQVGDTDLYTWCSATVSNGYKDLIRTPMAFEAETELTDGAEKPIISFRPAQTYLGADNRYRYLLQYISTFSTTEPVMLTLYAKADLSNDTWSDNILGLEKDTDANVLVSGFPYGKRITPGAGTSTINLMESGSDSSTDGLFRQANISNTDVWTITARKISGGNTTVIVAGAFFQVE